MKKHLILLASAATIILVGLVAFGVDLAQALPFALVLACPLSMIAMMYFMNRHGTRGRGEPSTSAHDQHAPSRDNHERLT
ncbi:DUF2933 domain-containing protein [uncultured Microbacterium sp.]|uniref:DUF2933 domain-containing protein n=1 Tax=uncultured Microbacterium sp. TaxID=191216 RepID=A0A1Y5NZ85_9MICO|nr:DUF2933 domain-containing protein [uncultured Microbacterium sp.]SBS71787.1 conserved exported hypothetical protein [uncultured Microbacterium sp.]